MIRLRTIGPVFISIDDTGLSPSNNQVFSALLYLVVERGRPISRRLLAEFFFPDANGPGHSVRQLVYRLRQLGIPLGADQRYVTLAASSAAWDVETIVERGLALEAELEALQAGYLTAFTPRHSGQFDIWLEEHRGSVASRLRHVLVRQLRDEKKNRHYRSVAMIARACLALDPMNEEATLASAAALAMTGAKVDALSVLSRYIEELGPGESSLHLAPHRLREQISTYMADADRERVELIGRDAELSVLSSALEQSFSGAARMCLLTGPSGIGKSRLLDEACETAALSGRGVIRARIHPHDVARPFALLRDLGPSLLDSRGSLGASAEALATLRGLCGRGPSTYRQVPSGAFETHAVASEVHTRVLEVLDAVAEEQPLLLSIEDAQWIDDASLQLLAEILDGPRAVCILVASQRVLQLPTQLATTLAVSLLPLRPLTLLQSRAVLERLFAQVHRSVDEQLVTTAVSTSGGIPFYLNLLFHNFLATGDPEALPATLAESLSARLDQLTEPARTVFDAVVILGPYSSEARLEHVTQLPRYLLIQAIRWLNEFGFVRGATNIVTPTHDLLATAARKRMPISVARLLHRATATALESESDTKAEPLAIAMHWEACDEYSRAVNVLTLSASQSSLIGRPREAMELISRAKCLAKTDDSQRELDVLLVHLCRAAGADSAGVEVATRLGLYGGREYPELQVIAFEFLVGAGQDLVSYAGRLGEIAADTTTHRNIRARAARLLVILAEDLGDAALGRRAVSLISDGSEPACEVLGTELIYHTVFGSTERAVTLAALLREAALHMPIASERVKYIANAGVAMWRCGEGHLALQYCEEAYNLAKEAKVWSACTGYAAFIAEIHWTLGHREPAEAWFARASEHLRKSNTGDRQLSVQDLAILIALDKDDVEGADALLDEAERRFTRVRGHRMGVHRLAFRIRIDLAKGREPSGADVDELKKGHLKRREHGLHDLVADTLIAALLVKGEHDQARLYRSEYLTLRKDRFPLAASLVNLRLPDGC